MAITSSFTEAFNRVAKDRVGIAQIRNAGVAIARNTTKWKLIQIGINPLQPCGTGEKMSLCWHQAVKNVGRGALDVWLPQEVASFTFLKVAVHLARGVMPPRSCSTKVSVYVCVAYSLHFATPRLLTLSIPCLEIVQTWGGLCRATTSDAQP